MVFAHILYHNSSHTGQISLIKVKILELESKL